MAQSRFFIVPLIAALALMPMSAWATDGNSVGTEPLVATEITREMPYSAEDISERAAHLRISMEEAELRLQLERASIGFEPELIEAFGQTFGGVWLEADGAPSLTVALTNGAEAALPVIQSMFAVPDAVRTVTVKHSLADLLALQETMIAERAALQAGEVPLVNALASTAGNYDLDVDVLRNVVVVHLEDATDALVSAFTETYGGACW